MSFSRALALLCPAAICLLIAACTDRSPANALSEIEQPAVRIEANDPGTSNRSPIDPGFELPPPSQLPFDLQPRSASYTEASLFTIGSQHLSSLPHQNWTEISPTGGFDPDWTTGLDGAAFAMYSFTVDGYDRAPELRYRWQVEPEPIGLAYIGLANYAEDRWDWWQCRELGWFNFGDITPYTRAADDQLIAAAVVVGSGHSELRYLRLGPSGVTADLNTSPPVGIVPVDVRLIGSGSMTTYSTIETFSWDVDGDGSTDSSGAEDNVIHTYSEPGTYKPRLTVETAHGELAAATTKFSVYDPWTHSWGGTEEEKFYAVASDGDALYAAGSTSSFANNPDSAVLLIKYALDGSLEWARSWSGLIRDAAYDVCASAAYGIFTVGECHSYGAGGADILIQRWDAQGNLEWSTTWGKAGAEYAVAVDIYDGVLYVGGTTTSYDDPAGDSIVMACDLSGNILWERAYGFESSADGAADIDVWNSLFNPNPTVYVLANSNINEDTTAPFIAQFDEEGAFTIQNYWFEDFSVYCHDLFVTGLVAPKIYVCGSMDNFGTMDAILLELNGNDLKLNWNLGGDTVARGIIMLDDNLYICGNFGDAENNCFLAQLSTAGAVENAMYWSDTGSYQEFFGMIRFPGSGLTLFGAADSASGSWQQTPLTTQSQTWPWDDTLPNLYIPEDPVVGSPVQGADEITDGVEDIPASETGYETFICTVAQ